MFLSPNKSTLCSVQQSRCKVRIPEMYTIENMYVKTCFGGNLFDCLTNQRGQKADTALSHC